MRHVAARESSAIPRLEIGPERARRSQQRRTPVNGLAKSLPYTSQVLSDAWRQGDSLQAATWVISQSRSREPSVDRQWTLSGASACHSRAHGRGPGRPACRRRVPAGRGRRRTACVCRMPARACSCRRRRRPRRAGPAGPESPDRAEPVGAAVAVDGDREVGVVQGAQQAVDMGGGHERQVGSEDHDGIRNGSIRKGRAGSSRQGLDAVARPATGPPPGTRSSTTRTPSGTPWPGPTTSAGRPPAASSTRATSGRPPTSRTACASPCAGTRRPSGRRRPRMRRLGQVALSESGTESGRLSPWDG